MMEADGEEADPAAFGAVMTACGAAAACARQSDRAMPEDVVAAVARAAVQVAVFAAEHLARPEDKAPLPLVKKATPAVKKRRVKRVVARLGIADWAPDYRGFGLELLSTASVAVAAKGEAGDVAVLRCLGRLRGPLDPKSWGDDFDELEGVPPLSCDYEFWTDETADYSTAGPPLAKPKPKRGRRPAGARCVGRRAVAKCLQDARSFRGGVAAPPRGRDVDSPRVGRGAAAGARRGYSVGGRRSTAADD